MYSTGDPVDYHMHDTNVVGQQNMVTMELDNWSLWSEFSAVGTEMIVTKSGRLDTFVLILFVKRTVSSKHRVQIILKPYAGCRL
jgi:T-box